jgi:calmodulin
MEMVENFKEAFALFDKDNKSQIDVKNLGRVMR